MLCQAHEGDQDPLIQTAKVVILKPGLQRQRVKDFAYCRPKPGLWSAWAGCSESRMLRSERRHESNLMSLFDRRLLPAGARE